MLECILKLANYFFKYSDYELFREKVEQLSKKNPYPFKDWFGPNGRTYIPFGGEVQTDDEDKWVFELLQEHGWTITDYKGGYAQKAGRTMRIGKIFPQIKKETELQYKKELEEAQKRNADEFEIDNIEQRQKKALNFIEDTYHHFISTPTRGQKSGRLSIVISQNPHDIATMSTDRSWESCMTLGTGGHHQDVYCEVERGGLVAYLIDEEDVDIKHPHARIHIRRFDDRNGNSIAVPEKSVYGNDIPGFHDKVEKWINSVQKQKAPGIYERQGGKWSDTFQQTHVVTPEVKYDTPEGQNELANWLKGIGLPDNAVYMKYKVNDNLYDETNDEEFDYDRIKNRSAEFLSKEEAEKYIQEQNWLEETDTERELHWDPERWNEFDDDAGSYKIPRFSLQEVEIDNRPELKMEAASKLMKAGRGQLSQDVLNTLKEYLFTEGKYSPLRTEFINKYPELLTQEEGSALSDNEQIQFIKSLPQEQQVPYITEWNKSINRDLTTGDTIITEEAKRLLQSSDVSIIPGRSTKDYGGTIVSNNFYKFVETPISDLFDRIPEETVQNLIAFSSKLEEAGIDNDSTASKRINENIMFLFALKNADSPAVQDYYKSQLFRWDQQVRGSKNNTHLIYALGSLNENGRYFLPFLREKLEDSKERYNQLKASKEPAKEFVINTAKQEVVNILWAIDSIETGKYSQKYVFKH